MSELHQGRHNPQVGTLSPDGSRMWDGNFWVRIRSDRPLDPLPPSPLRPLARVHASDTRGFRPGGMVLAGVVAAVMSNIHPTLPFSDGSAAATLTEMRLAGFLLALVTYVAGAVTLRARRPRS